MVMMRPIINPKNYHIAIDGSGNVYRLYKGSSLAMEQVPFAGHTIVTPETDSSVMALVKPSSMEKTLLRNNLAELFFDSDGMLRDRWTACPRLMF